MPKFNKRRSHSRKQNRTLKSARYSSITKKEDKYFVVGESEQLYNPKQKENIDFLSKNMFDNVTVLFTLCGETVNNKYLSTLMYVTLRHLGQSWRDVDAFLGNVGGMTAETCHKHTKVFLDEDIDRFSTERRGGKQTNSFFDIYPELEELSRVYAIESCSRKNSSFTVKELADYIDQEYYILTGEQKENKPLVRSIPSVRLDLRRWGIHYSSNRMRPYWLGHERADVVEHRKEIVDYFMSRKFQYYTISEGPNPQWILPTSSTPVILLCHDESTLRSNEISNKRWMIGDKAPFFAKGHGHSLMCSDFLICHPSSPFFFLDDEEWAAAMKKYPELAQDTEIDYIPRTASASITLGLDNYFTNSSILSQFERLFKMLSFKKEFKGHEIELLVDNATTHSVREYNINDFGRGMGTRCPVTTIEWFENSGEKKKLDCFFPRSRGRSKSKGLLVISQELGLDLSPKISLADLKSELLKHPAFKNVTKIEKLGNDYNVKVIFLPKYHSEMSSIEGLWCHMKQYVRKYSEQNFPRMLTLVGEARENFEEKNVNIKLQRRFWKCLYSYTKGKEYQEVLSLFFSTSCQNDVQSHRKITNANISS